MWKSLGALLDGACAWDSKINLAQSVVYPRPVILTLCQAAMLQPFALPQLSKLIGNRASMSETEPIGLQILSHSEEHKRQHTG